MSFFVTGIALQVKRLLRRPAAMACLLVLPLLALMLGALLPAGAAEDPVRVGVWLPESSQRGARLWQVLSGYSDGDVRYELAETPQYAEQMVAAGVWECAYVAADDLDDRIERGRWNRLMTRYDSAQTTLAKTLDWTLAAALLEVCTPQLLAGYLDSSGIAPGTLAADVEQLLLDEFGGQFVMQLDVVSISGGQPTAAASASTGASLVRGVTALVLLLFACLCAIHFSQDLSSGFFSRMRPFCHPARLFFPSYAACMLLAGIAGGASLFIGAAFFPHYFGGLWREGAALLLYLLYLAAFSFFLSGLFPAGAALASALPFVMVACLLFCPVFIDISQFLPAGRWVSVLLPPTLYLQAAAGRTGALWQMPLASLALLLAGFVLARLRMGRHSAAAA